ncbi:CTD kinase subunit alpha [Smittium mucronatum]|uniref:cyclin-dependent kinase n=1 Tax=Smittium mucronatum TaxID=133383 RepID=A0A1R0GX94_9FUNG|nr:CTD kinase subunit alpha [Smittium mucronatum]
MTMKDNDPSQTKENTFRMKLNSGLKIKSSLPKNDETNFRTQTRDPLEISRMEQLNYSASSKRSQSTLPTAYKNADFESSLNTDDLTSFKSENDSITSKSLGLVDKSPPIDSNNKRKYDSPTQLPENLDLQIEKNGTSERSPKMLRVHEKLHYKPTTSIFSNSSKKEMNLFDSSLYRDALSSGSATHDVMNSNLASHNTFNNSIPSSYQIDVADKTSEKSSKELNNNIEFSENDSKYNIERSPLQHDLSSSSRESFKRSSGDHIGDKNSDSKCNYSSRYERNKIKDIGFEEYPIKKDRLRDDSLVRSEDKSNFNSSYDKEYDYYDRDGEKSYGRSSDNSYYKDYKHTSSRRKDLNRDSSRIRDYPDYCEYPSRGVENLRSSSSHNRNPAIYRYTESERSSYHHANRERFDNKHASRDRSKDRHRHRIDERFDNKDLRKPRSKDPYCYDEKNRYDERYSGRDSVKYEGRNSYKYNEKDRDRRYEDRQYSYRDGRSSMDKDREKDKSRDSFGNYSSKYDRYSNYDDKYDYRQDDYEDYKSYKHSTDGGKLDSRSRYKDDRYYKEFDKYSTTSPSGARRIDSSHTDHSNAAKPTPVERNNKSNNIETKNKDIYSHTYFQSGETSSLHRLLREREEAKRKRDAAIARGEVYLDPTESTFKKQINTDDVTKPNSDPKSNSSVDNFGASPSSSLIAKKNVSSFSGASDSSLHLNGGNMNFNLPTAPERANIPSNYPSFPEPSRIRLSHDVVSSKIFGFQTVGGYIPSAIQSRYSMPPPPLQYNLNNVSHSMPLHASVMSHPNLINNIRPPPNVSDSGSTNTILPVNTINSHHINPTSLPSNIDSSTIIRNSYSKDNLSAFQQNENLISGKQLGSTPNKEKNSAHNIISSSKRVSPLTLALPSVSKDVQDSFVSHESLSSENKTSFTPISYSKPGSEKGSNFGNLESKHSHTKNSDLLTDDSELNHYLDRSNSPHSTNSPYKDFESKSLSRNNTFLKIKDHQAVGSSLSPDSTVPNVKTISNKPSFKFEIISQVGEGTYGKVFKANMVNSSGKSIVALKRIRIDQERDGFPITAMREIKIMKYLNHPNIVKLIDVISNSNKDIYMVMEYLGYDLSGLLARSDWVLEQKNIKDLMYQLLSGLNYMHQLGFVHRDIKGSNILLNEHGDLKIVDFGLARQYNNRNISDPESNSNMTNRVITLWYRPPELLLGSTNYGPEVDIWSSGCVMAELYTRKPTFQGSNEIATLGQIFSLLGPPLKKKKFSSDVNISNNYFQKEIENPTGSIRTKDLEVDGSEYSDYYSSLPWFNLMRPKTIYPNNSSNKEYFGIFNNLSKLTSKSGLELISEMLNLEPKLRPSAKDCLEHDYFVIDLPKAEPVSSFPAIGDWHDFESKAEKKRKLSKLKKN